jgi:hypothetical protein
VGTTVRRLNLTHVSEAVRRTPKLISLVSVETLRRTYYLSLYIEILRLKLVRLTARRTEVETRSVYVCLTSQIEALRRITHRPTSTRNGTTNSRACVSLHGAANT